MGLERHIATRDHLAALLDLPAIQQSEREVAGRVVELIELMNLQSYRDKFVSELSTGVRRIVDLTMAIAHNPTVLLLDEPSSGVAQRETEALGPLLKDMQRATQCSIVIIEHDMPLISAVSDEIIALDLGRVVTRGVAVRRPVRCPSRGLVSRRRRGRHPTIGQRARSPGTGCRLE